MSALPRFLPAHVNHKVGDRSTSITPQMAADKCQLCADTHAFPVKLQDANGQRHDFSFFRDEETTDQGSQIQVYSAS